MLILIRSTLLLTALVLLAGCANPQHNSSPYAHLVTPYVDLTAAMGDPDALAYIHRHHMVEMADNHGLERADWERQYFGKHPELQDAGQVAILHTRAIEDSPQLIREHFEENARMHLSVANTLFMLGQWSGAAVTYDFYRLSLDDFMPHLTEEQQAVATNQQAWLKEQIADARYQR